jgi:hypothetical protein
MALLGAEFLDGTSTWDQKERKKESKQKRCPGFEMGMGNRI